MEYKKHQLKMFQFDCVFDRLEERPMRELLGSILSLRKEGYLAYHAYGILPTDTYDFIGTHYGVCVETEEGTEILMSFRTTEWKRCQEFSLFFPLESILKNGGALEHLDVLNQHYERATAEAIPVIYTSSWTISPKARGNPELYQTLYDMFFAMNMLKAVEDPNAVRLACGSIRLKTVNPIQYMGYEYFKKNEIELGCFRQFNFNNEEVMALQLKTPALEAVEKAKVYELNWRRRRIIARPELEKKIRKAG